MTKCFMSMNSLLLFIYHYSGYNCRVISVLDEMIQIEYDKEEIEGKKRPRTEWIETDVKSLVIKELYSKPHSKNKANAMQVDK